MRLVCRMMSLKQGCASCAIIDGVFLGWYTSLFIAFLLYILYYSPYYIFSTILPIIYSLLFSSVQDTNGDGKISWQEFLNATADRQASCCSTAHFVAGCILAGLCPA